MTDYPTSLSGGNSKLEPPDPIPNSEVKQLSADGSVGPPHVRVGHRQALNLKTRSEMIGFFFALFRGSETSLSLPLVMYTMYSGYSVYSINVTIVL